MITSEAKGEVILDKKRYILFGFYTYYPCGGMDDAIMSFDTLEELIENSSYCWYDYYNILDTESFTQGRGTSPSNAFKDLESE